MKRLATIIVCLGKPNETRECLKSLQAARIPNQKTFLIENGSKDNFKLLSKEFPDIEYICLDKNHGFSGGVNIGIQNAKKNWNPDYYLLLNNDAIIKNESIQMLIETMEQNPQCGLCAPKILKDEKEKLIWAAGGRFDSFKFIAKNRGQNTIDRNEFDQSQSCVFLPACALLIRKEVIESVGLLDERFFTYSEDLDYCLRCRKMGWILLYQAKSCVIHAGSATAGGEYEPFQSFYRWRNRFLLINKHAGFFHKTILFAVFAPLLIFRDSIRYLRIMKFKSLLYCWAGLCQFILLVFKRNVNPLRQINHMNISTYTRLNRGYLVKNPWLFSFLITIDFMGRLFFTTRNNTDLINPKKILISKIDHLGDVLLSLYLIPHIKNKFPSAQIYYLCGSWAKNILAGNPCIDRIYTFDHALLNRQKNFLKRSLKMLKDSAQLLITLRKESIDLAIDARAYFPNSIPLLGFAKIKRLVGFSTGGFGFLLNKQIVWRDGIHETEHLMDILSGILNRPCDVVKFPELNYLLDTRKTLDFFNQKRINLGNPFVVIHPYAQNSNLGVKKYWENVYWKILIEFLEKKRITVLCTGDREDRPLIELLIEGTKCHNFAGETSILLFANILKMAKIVLSIDTFASHLASSLNVKTIVFFHGDDAQRQWKPWGESTIVFQNDCDPKNVIEELERYLKYPSEETDHA